MNKILRALAMVGLVFITSCATANAPTPASSLAEAEQSATLATKAVDLYVKNGKLNRADLLKIQQANNVVHAALIQLEHDQQTGVALQFSAFNSAIAAFNAYEGK